MSIARPFALENEVEVIPRTANVSSLVGSSGVLGDLWVTSLRIAFRAYTQLNSQNDLISPLEEPSPLTSFDLYFGSICAIKEQRMVCQGTASPMYPGNEKCLRIQTNRLQQCCLGFGPDSKVRKMVSEAIIKHFKALSHKPWPNYPPHLQRPSQIVLDQTNPFQAFDPPWLMDLLKKGSFKLDHTVNKKFKLGSLLPEVLVLPNSVTAQQATSAAATRQGKLLPLLCWANKNGALLLRCNAFQRDRFSATDKIWSRAHALKANSPVITVVDLARRANEGQTTEHDKPTDVPMDTTLSSAFVGARDAIFDGKDVKALPVQRWLSFLNRILDVSILVQRSIREGTSILLQGSPKVSATFAIVSLVKIAEDPFFRTLRGICAIIENDWIGYAFPFHSHRVDGGAPVFEAFLQMLYAVVHYYHFAFEYNERLLLYLLSSLYSLTTLTFMFDDLKARQGAGHPNLPSVYDRILDDLSILNFTNPNYRTSANSVLDLSVFSSRITLWRDAFFQYDLETYDQHAALAARIWNPGPPTQEQTVRRPLHLSSSEFGLVYRIPVPFLQRASPPLTELHLDGCQFSALPYELAMLKLLEVISFASNPIRLIPADWTELIGLSLMKLRLLNFDRTSVLTFPPQIASHIPSLTTLSFNQLMLGLPDVFVIPPQPSDMPTGSFVSIQISRTVAVNLNNLSSYAILSELNLTGCGLETFPEFLATMPQLVRLQLNQNDIHALAAAGPVGKTFPSLLELHVADNVITTITGNPLLIFPALTTLNLQGNRIASLDDRLFATCTNLAVLNLSHNELIALPNSLRSLTALSHLQLQHNRLTAIPNYLCDLPNLTHLDISSNRITALPVYIGNASRLRHLNLASNLLEDVSPQLARLYDQLKFVSFDQNPLGNLPPSIVETGSRSILAYLRDLMEDVVSVYRAKLVVMGQEKVGKTTVIQNMMRAWAIDEGIETPVATTTPQTAVSTQIHAEPLLGMAAATTAAAASSITSASIAQSVGIPKIVPATSSLPSSGPETTAISGPHDQPPPSTTTAATSSQPPAPKYLFSAPNILSTDGIHITKSTFRHVLQPTGKEVKVDVQWWDLAGQELYYVSHQFFLTSRALFILVWSLRDPDMSRIRFWMNLIISRVANPVICLVGTHLDKLKPTERAELPELMRRQKVSLRMTFPKSRMHFITVSNKTSENSSELKAFIEHHAVSLPEFGEVLPVKYLLLERSLIEFQRGLDVVPIVSRNQFHKLAANVGLTGTGDWLQATLFLHDAGVLLYFPRDPVLSHHVILNPQWLARIMATLITTKHSFAQSGIVPNRALPHIWKDLKPSCYALILGIFERFELVYPVPEAVVHVVHVADAAGGSSLLVGSNAAKKMGGAIAPPSFLGAKMTPSPIHLPKAVVTAMAPQAELNWDAYNLVPAMLPPVTSDPQAMLRNDMAVARKTAADSVRFRASRAFRFGFLPDGLFSRLIVRILHLFVSRASQLQSLHVFRTAVTIRHEAGIIHAEAQAAEPQDPINDAAVLRIITMGPTYVEMASLFSALLEGCHALFNEWPYLESTAVVPCPKCDPLMMAAAPEDDGPGGVGAAAASSSAACGAPTNACPAVFHLDALLTAFQLDQTEVICGHGDGGHMVKLSQLIPDVRFLGSSGKGLSWHDLEIGEKVGEGAFAMVYCGRILSSGHEVAIKRLNVPGDAQNALPDHLNQAFQEFRREAYIMMDLEAPQILRLVGICLKPPCMVTELAKYGSLYTHLNKPEDECPLSWEFRLRVATDLAEGLAYLHSLKPPLIHNDLKSPNVLLMSLDPAAEVVAKIIDFGLSVRAHQMHIRRVDNPIWLAPEICRGQTYGIAADVYALGVMLWELVERRKFFNHIRFNSDVELAIMAGQRDAITQPIIPEYEHLLKRCWDDQPNRRPTARRAADVLHQLMQKYQKGQCKLTTPGLSASRISAPKHGESPLPAPAAVEERGGAAAASKIKPMPQTAPTQSPFIYFRPASQDPLQMSPPSSVQAPKHPTAMAAATASDQKNLPAAFPDMIQEIKARNRSDEAATKEEATASSQESSPDSWELPRLRIQRTEFNRGFRDEDSSDLE